MIVGEGTSEIQKNVIASQLVSAEGSTAPRLGWEHRMAGSFG